MCKHKNIEIHRVSTYIIPQGWTKLVEQDDIDLGEYFVEENQDRVVCQDCAEVVD